MLFVFRRLSVIGRSMYLLLLQCASPHAFHFIHVKESSSANKFWNLSLCNFLHSQAVSSFLGIVYEYTTFSAPVLNFSIAASWEYGTKFRSHQHFNLY